MTGVEILTSNEVVTASVFNIEACIIAFVIVFSVVVFIGFIDCCIDGFFEGMSVSIIFGIIMGLITGVVGGVVYPKPTSYEIQYKATISDDVIMTSEFTSKYEIIEQDEKIYTIKEK